MAIFKRRKNENEDDEEDLIEQEEKEIKKFNRKLKDLKSANKKKRKEPPMPWGKKERYIVLAILAATVLFAALLATRSTNGVAISIGKPSFSFDFSKLNPFKEKIIIIEKK